MRVTSLIGLLLVVGGVAFVFIHEPTRSWLFKKTAEATLEVEGYHYAKTPRDAMDNFMKAVKARNYKAAARYCSDDYARLLEKAHVAGYETGTRLDKIYNLLQGKQFRTPMAMDLLIGMDPFPTNFDYKDVKESKKGDTAEGVYVLVEPKYDKGNRLLSDTEKQALDPKLYFQFVLKPVLLFAKLNIKKDDKDIWKIDFALATAQKEYVDHFLDNYKRYLAGYDQFIAEMHRETFLADQVGPELYKVISSSK